MSQAINTGAIPTRGIAPTSRIRHTAIIVGVAIAGLLGYAAALVATGHLPWIDHQAATPLAIEATPGTRSDAVGSGVVDPFEAQFATGAAQATLGLVGGTSLEAVTHSALNPFELRSASVAIETSSGSIVLHSALNPFELLNDVEPATDTGPPAIPRSGTGYPRPAFG